MNEEEIVGGKIELDISELSKNLKQANKLINLSNQEFNAATAGMDNWRDSAEGLNAKIKNLNDVTEVQRKKIANLQKEYNDMTENGTKPATNASIDLAAKINKELAALQKNESELEKCKNALKELSSESDSAVTTYDKLTSEIESQEEELKNLQKQYSNVVLEQGENSKEAKELKTQMSKLNDSLKENKTELNKAESASDKFTDALKDIDKGANDADDGFTILKGSIATFVGNVITDAVSKIGDLAGSLFDLIEATEEYRSMNAKLEGAALNSAHSVEFVKDKYEELYGYLGDSQMATNGITNLTGLAIETQSVSDLVEGAIGVWASYGDSIPIESLTEAINETIQVGKVTGTFADTINWSTWAVDGADEALQGHNESLKAFNKALDEGESVEDAFSAALEATTNVQERADIVAGFLNTTYGESKKTYDELNGSMINANKAEMDLLDSQSELAEVVSPVKDAFTELKAQALEALLPVVEKVVDKFFDFKTFLEENPEVAKIVTGAVLGLATAFGVLATALAIQGLIKGVTWAIGLLNTTLLANPIVLIVAAIAGLVAAFIYFWNTSDKFREFWTNLWDIIVGAVKTGWEWIKGIFDTIITFVTDNWQNLLLLLVNPFAGAFKLLYDNCEGFRTFIDEFVQNVKDFFVNGWNAIVTFFTEGIPAFIESVKLWFADLPAKLGYLIGQLIGHVILFFQRLWTFATVDIPNFITKVIEWFATLPGRIWEWLVQAYTKVVTWGTNTVTTGKQKASEFLESVVNFFKELPGKVWKFLTDTVTKTIEWGANMIKTGKEKIGEFKDGIIEKIENLPEDMKEMGKNILDGFVNGVKENITGAINSVKKFFGGIADGVKDVLQIHSPSRVFAKMGIFSAEGYGEGFEDEIGKVKKSLMNSMDLGNDMNVNLNKTGYKNGSNGSNGRNVIVNQTINSPKSLSRKEIYRQTKNVANLLATT